MNGIKLVVGKGTIKEINIALYELACLKQLKPRKLVSLHKKKRNLKTPFEFDILRLTGFLMIKLASSQLNTAIGQNGF